MCCNVCDPKSKYTNCICNKDFINFDDYYHKIKTLYSPDKDKFSIIKPLTISTMTLCCNLNSKIQIEKYYNNYTNFTINKKFFNCMTVYISVKYQKRIKVSIKFFTNGKVQLAGALNLMSATYAIRKIFNRLNKIGAFENTDAHISDLRICMINSDFRIDKNIKQKLFCEDLENNDYNFLNSYSFNPSKYPGINMKIKTDDCKKFITCSVFRPGSVILTGGKDLKLYFIFLEKLLHIISNNNILY